MFLQVITLMCDKNNEDNEIYWGYNPGASIENNVVQCSRLKFTSWSYLQGVKQQMNTNRETG